jgi:hypothetical protein
VIAALIIGLIVFVIVWRFFHGYQDYEAGIKNSEYPVLPVRHGALPAEPRLEQIERMAGSEKGNIYLRQEQKEALLNSYGEIADGFIHIPIDRAMDLLADKLPARVPPSGEQARRQNGLLDSGASNSGRMFRGSPHE